MKLSTAIAGLLFAFIPHQALAEPMCCNYFGSGSPPRGNPCNMEIEYWYCEKMSYWCPNFWDGQGLTWCGKNYYNPASEISYAPEGDACCDSYNDISLFCLDGGGGGDRQRFCPHKGGEGKGDPHFKTWADTWYDFHGVCDLVFVQSKDFQNGLGLDIHIRTKERDAYSYIESATIKIGCDVLEVGGWGDWWLNGVEGSTLPPRMADQFEITHAAERKTEDATMHSFTINISEGEQIVVSAFKDMVSIKVDGATEANYGNSVGLMGAYDGGILKKRDGTIAHHDQEGYNEFGQDWQVRPDVDGPMLFQATRTPQYPQVCSIPDPTQQARRRLGENAVSREAAEIACAHVEEGDERDMCIFDVLAMNDLDVAHVSGAF